MLKRVGVIPILLMVMATNESSYAQGDYPIVNLNGTQSAATILVPSPGEDQDIQPNLQAAVNGANPGDTILLPAGHFYLDGKVVINGFVSIRGMGHDEGGTLLYRREEITDDQLNSWGTMMEFRCHSDEPSQIMLSDIYFRGKNPSLIPGDGGSTANDYGVQFKLCVDFVVARNRFEHFGFAAVYVYHRDNLARGLVAENEFFQNLNVEPGQDYFDLGYGVVLYGEDLTWSADPQFGTDNFIFVEDNTFIEHRHSVASGGMGRYVFRNNEVIDNLITSAVDAHGGGMYGNTLSTRAFEVYENNLYNTRFKDGTPIDQPPPNSICSDLVPYAIYFRGGEGLVHRNTIQAYRYGVGVATEITGTYPVITQIGYNSGLNLGPSHTGVEWPASDGDVFIWGNNFIPFAENSCIRPFINSRTELLQEGRDYHLEVPKPNYTPYTYPHPLRELIPGPLTTFEDVPFDHWAHDYIEVLYQEGYIVGCSTNPLLYCPEQAMNRAESAVFVERGIHSASYEPPGPSSAVFADLPLESWAADWVNGLWQDKYTAGCGTNPLVYCPWQGHSRAEGCVFYLRMLNGASFEPPQPTVQTFSDVPLGTWYAKWAQAAYDAGLIPACQTTPQLAFCPENPLTRALAAYMMVQARGLLTP